MRRLLLPIVPILFALAGCNSSMTPFEVATRADAPAAPTTVPEIAPVIIGTANSVSRSNASLAQDFMNLSFALESGTQLSTLTRFEGPITVRLTGNATTTTRSDLQALLSRLRNEAGIPITAVTDPNANITMEMVSRAQIQKLIPNAACFVAPNVRSLRDYAKQRRSSATSWSGLTERRVMSIFLPSDSSPQEIRDCMHEELAQALGPVNDLYSLNNSVFNDDNMHATLTSFDMLMLRVHYAPEFKNGMTRNDVAMRIHTVLARLNPTGSRINSEATASNSVRWNSAVQTALGAGVSASNRVRAAEQAIAIARAENFEDVRLGYSYFVLGRVTVGLSMAKGKQAFEMADRVYASLPDTGLQRAFVAAQLGAFSLADGNSAETLSIVRPYMNIAKASGNSSLLSTLMLIEAEALDLAGHATVARSVRLDTQGWARYGFGSEKAVQARQQEIASLSPR